MKKELQLVSFKQAQRLKELGFDFETTHFYIESEEENNVYPFWRSIESYGRNIYNWNNKEDLISAPTVALALKWFRDVKGIVNCIKREIVENDGTIEYLGQFKNMYLTDYTYDTYEAAEKALLDELLTLIENEEKI